MQNLLHFILYGSKSVHCNSIVILYCESFFVCACQKLYTISCSRENSTFNIDFMVFNLNLLFKIIEARIFQIPLYLISLKSILPKVLFLNVPSLHVLLYICTLSDISNSHLCKYQHQKATTLRYTHLGHIQKKNLICSLRLAMVRDMQI